MDRLKRSTYFIRTKTPDRGGELDFYILQRGAYSGKRPFQSKGRKRPGKEWKGSLKREAVLTAGEPVCQREPEPRGLWECLLIRYAP